VAQQLPDETTNDEARARERNEQTWVERVVEEPCEDGEKDEDDGEVLRDCACAQNEWPISIRKYIGCARVSVA